MMVDVNSISEKLRRQLSVIEKDATEASNRIRNVESYIDCRIKRVKKLLHLMKKSDDWMQKLSRVIDMLGDVQRVVEKIEEVEFAVTPVDEVSLDDLEYISSLIDNKLMELSDG